MTVARTERLALRRATLGDAPFYHALLTSEGFVRNIGDRGVRTLDDARAYVQTRFLDTYERLGFGMYTMVRHGDGVLLGQCGLVKRADDADLELGYALHPDHYGHGYAREAAAATLEHVRALGHTWIAAQVLPENTPSIRVLEALGFSRTGTAVDPADGALLERWGRTL